MNKLSILKTGVGIVVGSGVSKIVRAIVTNNIDPETRIDKITMFCGQVVLAMVVADAARKHSDHVIDDIAKVIVDAKKQIAAAK